MSNDRTWGGRTGRNPVAFDIGILGELVSHSLEENIDGGRGGIYKIES